jgi:glycosyltransferase involved in cell wall biosynthesis
MKDSPKPLFSIIIPTYNYARYLPRALDSILDQTGEDYEIVVVDDGSTDHTAEVIRGYQAKAGCPITYVFQENRGPSAARNHGVRLSTAPYLLFLDADDALLPGALDRFRSIIVHRADLDFIAGGRIYVTSDGRRRRRSIKALSGDKDRNFRRYLRGQLGRLCVQSLVVHRRVFDRIRFPEAIRNGEDDVYTAHLLALYNGTSFPEPVVTMYRHADSLSHDLNVVRQDRPKAVELLFDPAILPATLMPLRDEAFSLTCLAMFLFFYRRGEYEEAKCLYRRAIRTCPRHVLKFQHLRKYLCVALRATR